MLLARRSFTNILTKNQGAVFFFLEFLWFLRHFLSVYYSFWLFHIAIFTLPLLVEINVMIVCKDTESPLTNKVQGLVKVKRDFISCRGILV